MRPLLIRSFYASVAGRWLLAAAILMSLTGISHAKSSPDTQRYSESLCGTTGCENQNVRILIPEKWNSIATTVVTDGPLLAKLIIEDASPASEVTPQGYHDVIARVGYIEDNQNGPETAGIITFDRREALQVARTLARAKIALMASSGRNHLQRDREQITNLNDAMDYLETLSGGFPYEETWQTSEGEGEFTVRLRARLRKTDPAQDWIRAEVIPRVLSDRQSLTIKLDGLLDSTVAIYAWQADNTVVRLYPAQKGEPMDIRAGQRYKLPQSNDHIRALKVRPMPNSLGNHEAIIVLASDQPNGISALAPGIGATNPEDKLPSTDEFLNRLSKLQVGSYQLSFQTYQVLASE